jgi:hypothetical protein
VVAQFLWNFANYGNRLTPKIHERLIQMFAIEATAGNLVSGVADERRYAAVKAANALSRRSTRESSDSMRWAGQGGSRFSVR